MTTSHYLSAFVEGKTSLRNLETTSLRNRSALLLGSFGVLIAASPLALAQSETPGSSPAPAPLAATNGAVAPTASATPSATPADGPTTSAAVQARRATRAPRVGDYVAALGGLALVLSAKSHPATTQEKAFVGDQQYSVISPFPGGGFSVRPDGELRPGGAMQVNIPVAYTPSRLSGVASIDAAQTRSGDSLFNAEGRNGTLTLGVGFPLAGRGVWLSRMFLSGVSFRGGDRAYCALVQVAPETRSVPAIALGIQDATNARIRSPFIVATKQLGEQPVFATFGLGRGRFSGSSVFGGVSYAPVQRVSLSAEYDGLQINLGAGYALSQRLSLLASYNDLAVSSNRPAGRLGRRYQVGANFAF